MTDRIILKAPDKAEKVSDNIINQIRRLIASGELKPGDKIGSEKELISQVGVSKASLREALRVLEVMGVIEIRKGLAGGVFAADVDMKTTLISIMNFVNFEAAPIKDITMIRYILEPVIVQIVIPLITEKDIVNMEEMIEYESDPLLAGSIKGVGFHRYLARITHNPILILITDFIDNLLSDIKIKVNLGDDFYQKVRAFHEQTLQALRDHDVNGAIQGMIADVLFVGDRIATLLDSPKFDPALLQGIPFDRYSDRSADVR